MRAIWHRTSGCRHGGGLHCGCGRDDIARHSRTRHPVGRARADADAHAGQRAPERLARAQHGLHRR